MKLLETTNGNITIITDDGVHTVSRYRVDFNVLKNFILKGKEEQALAILKDTRPRDSYYTLWQNPDTLSVELSHVCTGDLPPTPISDMVFVGNYSSKEVIAHEFPEYLI